MSSKFFAEGNISDEDNDNNDNENQNQNRNQPSYQYDFMDEGRGDNEKRVVRTEKDKKWNIVKDLTVKIGSGLNSQDYEKVWTLLQDLLKEIEKAKILIQKEGYPPLFLRCLKKINDEINELNKDAEAKKKIKMKKHSATAFNTMSQKLKKIYPDFEEKIAELLAKGQEEESEEEESDIQQGSEEEEEEEEQDDKKLLESSDPMVRRKYWLRKIIRKESEDDKKEDGKGQDKKDEKKQVKKEVKKEKKDNFTKKKTNLQIQSIKDAENRMKEIRKNFMKLHSQEEREDYLLTMDKISDNSKGYKDFEQLSFYLLDIPIRIDVCRQMRLTHFPRTQWLKLYQKIKQVYHLLRESEEEDIIENIRLFDDSGKTEVVSSVTEEDVYLSLKTYLILIEGQIKKALIFVDSNELEYYERLQDLIGLVNLMYRISKEIQIKQKLEKEASQLAFKVLENIYFMDGPLIEKIKQELKEEQVEFLELNDETRLQNYANMILKELHDEESKVKALLYLIYNHTINRRDKGKELLVISTLSEQILQQDYYTQALYNRVLVQIGINAFRSGNIFEVQQFLYEMCSVARMKENTKDILKEYLAQGFSRHEKDIPKNKVLPAYLHLNVELIETIELVAAMLLEIPYTLTEGGRITSKTFKKFYYEFERTYFIEESLNNRDLIFAASLHLKTGNWNDCYDKLAQLNIWTSMYDADTTKSNLLRVVKEQSLKCYLIGNRKCFKSVSLAGLALKFSLEEKAIGKLICKLINEKILQGSITREGFLVFVQKKQSEMQKICETLFTRLEEMNNQHEQWFSQKVNAGYDSEEEGDKEEKTYNRKLNLAINEKLKAILSKRAEKY